jgi:hypothetical protein
MTKLETVTVEPQLVIYKRIGLANKQDSYASHSFIELSEQQECHFYMVQLSREGMFVTFYSVSKDGKASIIKMVDRVIEIEEA